MKCGWVYILECSDGSYYTGVTSDIDSRIMEHQQGVHRGYTYSRRPVKLLWTEVFPDIQQAIDMEKRIKGWTRKKKEALIARDFALLQELSISYSKNKRKGQESQSSTSSD